MLTGVNPPRPPRTTPRPWSPSAHGGQPLSRKTVFVRLRVSPCSRGSTLVHQRLGRRAQDLPVLTGVNPLASPARRPGAGSPRVHGGQPSASRVTKRSAMVSPCSRGSTVRLARVRLPVPGLPVLTGVNPPPTSSRTTRTRSPRAHGGQPYKIGLSASGNAVSPCSRGSTARRGAPRDRGLGLPVLTGVNPSPVGRGARVRWSPRAHGGQLPCVAAKSRTSSVSPCLRGSTAFGRMLARHEEGLPVLTGVNLALSM